MNSNQLRDALFSFLSEENTESLWMEEVESYSDLGGNIDEVLTPENGWKLIHYAAENRFTKILSWLISNGVDVNSRDLQGNTPFLIALDADIDCCVQENRDEIDFSTINCLVNYGADVDAQAKDGSNKNTVLDSYGKKAKEQYFKKTKQ